MNGKNRLEWGKVVSVCIRGRAWLSIGGLLRCKYGDARILAVHPQVLQYVSTLPGDGTWVELPGVLATSSSACGSPAQYESSTVEKVSYSLTK